MYNWFYFTITSWFRWWKANATKVSSELFFNKSLAFTIVPLLGSYFNQKFFGAFFLILFSVDILTCMNIVILFCLHFDKNSNVAFLTETSLIRFSVFCIFCLLYLFIYRGKFILAYSFNWMTPFIAFCLSCSFFHFIFYFLLYL